MPAPALVCRKASIETWLAKYQFTRLSETETWQLQAGGRYYVVRDDSSIIVFVQGQHPVQESGFKIVGCIPTPQVCNGVKPNAANRAEGLLRLAVEVYGGPILATFTDRDFSRLSWTYQP